MVSVLHSHLTRVMMTSHKRELDQFFTKPEIVDFCIQHLSSINDYTSIEPSAGNGDFFFKLPLPKYALDIDPKIQECAKQDFLTFQLKDLDQPINKPILVIGNPPFGKNSSLAIKFFNHAATFADKIAFIVPKTFEKISVQNRLNLYFVLEKNICLPSNSFYFDNKDYDVPCVFQIWTKTLHPRVKVNTNTTHPDFIFTDKINGDFAIQRVGVNAGKIKKEINNIASASHYFIKSVIDLNILLNRMNKMTFPLKYSSAGNPSISKHELIEAYKKAV